MVKIIVADDSMTIQKVVRITLANMSYEIIECHSELEIVDGLQQPDIGLIILDFNLSKEKSGDQLVSDIKKVAEEIPIMLMFGTFDNIDGTTFSNLGVADKVVKPFESSVFIEKCSNLIAGTDDLPVDSQEKEDQSGDQSESLEHFDEQLDDKWVVKSPGADLFSQETDSEIIKVEETKGIDMSNQLASQVVEWEMAIPGVIDGSNESNGTVAIPAVINGELVEPAITEIDPDWEVFENIDYESSSKKDSEGTDEFEFESEAEVEIETEADLPMLDSTQLKNDETGDIAIGEFIKDIRFEEDENAEPVDLNTMLDQEEQSADELWSVDDSSQLSETEKVKLPSDDDLEIEYGVANQPIDIVDPIEPELAETPNTSSVSMPEINHDEIMVKVKEMLPALVEKCIKDYCETSIEKIAWDIIPDLAENLIKKEIKKISETI